MVSSVGLQRLQTGGTTGKRCPNLVLAKTDSRLRIHWYIVSVVPLSMYKTIIVEYPIFLQLLRIAFLCTARLYKIRTNIEYKMYCKSSYPFSEKV